MSFFTSLIVGSLKEAQGIGFRRSHALDESVVTSAVAIVRDVRDRKDEALIEYTEKFDAVVLGTQALPIRVSQAEIDAAIGLIEPELASALRYAATRILGFHKRQVPESWTITEDDGTVLGSRVTPIRRVGIYVPGGRAFYPSSVLMNALPAIAAGVTEIAMVTPCGPDGKVAPVILAAASILDISEVYRVGGAQAIGALAYGTESIPAVDKIVGPGNAFVAAAKREVTGDVGIDMIAGPSEVLVIADSTANPKFIAIDLMAQAEHDPRAAVYLVTTDPSKIAAVDEALEELLRKNPRAEIVRESLLANAVAVTCPNLEVAAAVSNAIAPEHLELQVSNVDDLLGQITNAGAIFMGEWTPEAVGDYLAGPNHVLPTGGTARFSSPLSVDDFVKRSSIIRYTPEALERDAETVALIAVSEGLWAHARAATLRVEELTKEGL